MRALTRGLLGVAGFLLVWELFGRSRLVPSEYFPPPSVVAVELVKLLGDEAFLRDVLATVLALLIAVALSIGIAVPLGLVLGSAPSVRHATRAVVEFLRPIPSVALIPLAIVLLGIGPETKISLAVYAAIWPILFNTIYALDELDPLLVETARVFGSGRVRVLFSVALPSALPFVFTGIRLAATTTDTLRVHLAPTGEDTVTVAATDAAGNPVVSIGALTVRPFASDRLADTRDALF
ncbi:ABC transporter permease subunit, partial [Saccharothrix sp. MB29]|nr:ABC transporter permease subunit [Saccharothrix sp. MB29]